MKLSMYVVFRQKFWLKKSWNTNFVIDWYNKHVTVNAWTVCFMDLKLFYFLIFLLFLFQMSNFEAARAKAKTGLSLKSNTHKQIKLAKISKAHCGVRWILPEN